MRWEKTQNIDLFLRFHALPGGRLNSHNVAKTNPAAGVLCHILLYFLKVEVNKSLAKPTQMAML
jgi:hypothetical protein